MLLETAAAAAAGAAAAGTAAAAVRMRYPPGEGPTGFDDREPGALPLLALALLLGAGLGALAGVSSRGYPQALAAAAFLGLLAVLSLVDLERGLLPDMLTLPGSAAAIALSPWLAGGLRESMTGGGVAFLVMMLLYLFPLGALGAGDVKLAALLGFGLGFPRALDALAVGVLLGGMGALVYLLWPAPATAGGSVLRRMWQRRHGAMPYGPYLAAGGTVVLLTGGLWG